MTPNIRIGSANFGSTLKRGLDVDYRLTSPSAVLDQVERTLDVLEGIVHKAGEAGCDIVAFPESTLAMSRWKWVHPELRGEVLPEAVRRMLERLGGAAASHRMYLICCNDTWEPDGAVRNTAFFLDREGHEIGRYHKVGLPLHEQLKKPGDGFPVFETPDLGGVGILICYDMVFPEPARCMALGGAGILFVPTEGGAAFGGPDISLAAFRTRAVENFCYVVVVWGGGNQNLGSMIISPHGEILVEEREPGALAIADIDPFGGRQGGDFANWQQDLRARVFRERRPETYQRLTEPHPPVLDRLPPYTPAPAEEIAHTFGRAITVGHEHWDSAEELLRSGNIAQAIQALKAIKRDYPGTWFDRMADARLAELAQHQQGS
jgi:predicted amidohydrolase